MRTLIFTFLLLGISLNTFAIDASLNWSIKSSDPLIIVVLTNLPEGTKAKAYLSNDGMGYYDSTYSIVKGGQIEAGPFNMNGHKLPAGNYKFEVVIMPSQLQPDSVVSVIGDRGDKLGGPHVVGGMFGKSLYLKSVLALL